MTIKFHFHNHKVNIQQAGLGADAWAFDQYIMMNVTIDTVSPRGRCKASDQMQYHYLTPTKISLGADVWASDQNINLNCDDLHREV